MCSCHSVITMATDPLILKQSLWFYGEWSEWEKNSSPESSHPISCWGLEVCLWWDLSPPPSVPGSLIDWIWPHVAPCFPHCAVELVLSLSVSFCNCGVIASSLSFWQGNIDFSLSFKGLEMNTWVSMCSLVKAHISELFWHDSAIDELPSLTWDIISQKPQLMLYSVRI